jgi:hypothetical protein
MGMDCLTEKAEIVSQRVGKDKATPVQDWTGLEGSRRLRLPDFKTISI